MSSIAASRGWPPSAGRRRQRPHEFDHTGAGLREHAFHPRAEVLDVGDRDDRRFGLPVEVARPGQQRVVHHVDHDAVLDLVLRARDQFGGDPGIVVDITGPRRRAGERMRAHDRSVDLHEELGRGADEAVDRIAVARPEAAPQSPQHRMDVDRFARVHHDRAGDDGLGERSGADGVARRDDGGQIVVDVDAGFDPIAGRTRTSDEVRREHGGDCCIVDVAAHRHGGGAVGKLAHQHLRHDHVGRCARTKPEHAESHRCCAVDGRVVGERLRESDAASSIGTRAATPRPAMPTPLRTKR